MATTEALHYLPIADLAREIEARRLSPVEITEALLRRIETLDDRLHGYVTVTAERARADARRAEAEIQAGNYRGPLHGIPIALKDLYDTAGIRTAGEKASRACRAPACLLREPSMAPRGRRHHL